MRALDAAVDQLERAIVAGHRRDPASRLAAGVPGVGALAASAILASAPNPHIFKSGRDFAAWLGATPKQNSTGGKEKLGSITKQGNRYIRRLLVLGAISVLRAAPKRKGALCDRYAGPDGVICRSSVSDGINLALFDPNKAVGGAVVPYMIKKAQSRSSAPDVRGSVIRPLRHLPPILMVFEADRSRMPDWEFRRSSGGPT